MKTASELFRAFLDSEKIQYLEKEPMKEHTTFRIGGKCDFFVKPESTDMLAATVAAARELEIKYTVLGRGSNVLFADKGYGGAVISTEKLCKVETDGENIICECGAPITQVALTARDNSLTGLEFACGIPGSVGGAVFMNAGAYGGQISDVLTSSTYYEPQSGEIKTIPLSEHKYGYRESVYIDNPQRVVVSAQLKLKKGSAEEIRSLMSAHFTARREKQPLEFPSAGSVFKRCEGHFTGKMIEESGLKGYRIGGAEVSEKHAGFIINRDNATADDVLRLIEYIKSTITKNYGLSLECEMIYIS